MTKPKVVSRKEVFKSPRFYIEELVLDLGSKKKKVYAMKHQDIVSIIPMLDKDTVVLAKEYRPKAERLFISLPGGLMDKKGESLEACAKRELLEELGYSSSKIKRIISVYDMPGLSDMKTHTFLATGLKKRQQNLDEGEYITPMKVKLKDVPKLIKSGKIADAKTIIGLMMLLQK